MVRRHGWELPAHTFQVVAITVFFLLAVAFYVFLAPFVWVPVLEFIALALYSPVAVAVLLLYIRSSAIDPADPGTFAHLSQLKNPANPMSPDASLGLASTDILQRSPSQVAPSFLAAEYVCQVKSPCLERSGWMKTRRRLSVSAFLGVVFWWLTKDDTCRRGISLQKPLAEEDVLFCTLCNAEVRKFSKHCRSCDKCVDGFDHHCRWLNNCVGTKNYNTFVSLMASSLALLVLEWGIGMAVLVRCFVDKDSLERQILDKLGNSFSRAPFAIVVAICTLVSLLASIPLGELFFFHLILIKKGITTYEYVVAMRAQNEPQVFSVEGDTQSVPTSPSSSAGTGVSGSSSLRLQYNRGAWCTPPRVFVEHEDEIVPQLEPGTVPSTTDPDLRNAASRQENSRKKATIRISAWKLSRLKADEAARAAINAREKSSILRHLGPRRSVFTETGNSSSSNMSSQDGVSLDDMDKVAHARDAMSFGSRERMDGPFHVKKDNLKGSYDSLGLQLQSRATPSTHLTPFPAEGRYGFNPQIAGSHLLTPTKRSLTSNTTTGSEASSPQVTGGAIDVIMSSHSSVEFPQAWTVNPPACSDGYLASSGESADGTRPVVKVYPHACKFRDRVCTFVKEGGVVRDSRDQSRDKAGSIYHENDLKAIDHMWSLPSNSRYTLPVRPPQIAQTPLPSSSQIKTSQQSSCLTEQRTDLMFDNLIYSGRSIFYSDPLEEFPERSSKSVDQHHPVQHATEIRGVLTEPPAPNVLKPSVARLSLRSQSPVFAPKSSFQLAAVPPMISNLYKI